MAEPKVIFEDGQLVAPGYVEIDGTRYPIVEAEYEGSVPLSAYNLNKMQQEILEDMGSKTEIAKDRQCIGNLTDTYNDTATYDVGDIVIEGNRLWVCTTAITEAEEFDPEHWAKTSLKEMIGNANNRINNMLATEISNHSGKVRIGDMLIQYGKINITTPASGTANHTLTFPVAFSTTPAVYVTSEGNYNTHAQANNISTTSMMLRCRSLDGSEHEGRTFDWLAIGKANDVDDNYSENGTKTTIEDLESKINDICAILANCVKNTEYNDFKNNVYKKNEINNLFENIENNLGDLEEEQAEQNTNISNNTEEITKLKKENEELAQLMPWQTTEISESIHVEDAAKYGKNRLIPFGNLKQGTRSGKNKFIPLPTGNNGGITITRNEDGTYNLSGTATTDVNHTAFVDLDKSEIKNGVAYILSSTKNLPAGVSSRVEMYNGTSWLRAFISNISSTAYTSTGTANTTNVTRIRFGVFITAGTTVNIQNLGLQLEEGTVATDYEQYGVMPSVEFPSMPETATGKQIITKLGKNFIDNSKAQLSTKNGMTLSLNDEGHLVLNGTTSALTNFYIVNINKTLDNEEYTLSSNLDLTQKGFYRLRNSSDTSILQDVLKNAKTFELTEETVLSSILIQINAGVTFNNQILDMQLEEGNQATDYEPYHEEVFELDLGNAELAKIEDTNGNTVAQDRIVRRNVDGVWKWQIEKNVEEVTFDGTEAWRTSFVNTSVDTVRFAKQLNNVLGNKSCNNLLPTRTVEAHTDTEYLYLPDNGTIYININKNRLTSETIEAFQELLSNNNLKVYYATLATKYTDCPAELSAQLDKLNELSLEKGINNIFIESENGVTAELQLEYMQDNNIKYKTLADRITALENA